MNTLSLYEMTADYEQAFLSLADSDIPAEAIEDTLEAIEGELMLKGANVAAFVLNLEAEAEKIKEAENRIAARQKVFEAKAARIREYLRDNMERAGIKKIEAINKSFSVTLIAPRASVAINDESKLPQDCTKTSVSPDRTKIAEKLKSGEEVPGAHLEYKSGLRIG